MWKPVLLFITLVGWAFGAAAQTRGTPEEAQALVARAIALYDEIGREEAFRRFMAKDGDFIDRDLYVFVIGPDRLLAVNGAFPERVGIEVIGETDVDGQPYGRMLVEDATPDGAWVEYRRLSPASGAVERKRSWVVLHDGYVFGSGAYTP
jgi:cytochrome c